MRTCVSGDGRRNAAGPTELAGPRHTRHERPRRGRPATATGMPGARRRGVRVSPRLDPPAAAPTDGDVGIVRIVDMPRYGGRVKRLTPATRGGPARAAPAFAHLSPPHSELFPAATRSAPPASARRDGHPRGRRRRCVEGVDRAVLRGSLAGWPSAGVADVLVANRVMWRARCVRAVPERARDTRAELSARGRVRGWTDHAVPTVRTIWSCGEHQRARGLFS
jgi:hypothetical protein